MPSRPERCFPHQSLQVQGLEFYLSEFQNFLCFRLAPCWSFLPFVMKFGVLKHAAFEIRALPLRARRWQTEATIFVGPRLWFKEVSFSRGPFCTRAYVLLFRYGQTKGRQGRGSARYRHARVHNHDHLGGKSCRESDLEIITVLHADKIKTGQGNCQVAWFSLFARR